MILRTPGTRAQNGILAEGFYDSLDTAVLQDAFDTFRSQEQSTPVDARHYVLRNAVYGYVGDILNHDEFESWALQRMTFHRDKHGSRPVIDTHLHKNLRTPPDRIVSSTILTEPELPAVIEACRFVLGGTTKNFWVNATRRYAQGFPRHSRFGEQKAHLALDKWPQYTTTLQSLGLFAIARSRVPKTRHAQIIQLPMPSGR